ncbi:MAG: KDO2-lipid IV(A) lauroyltransferase [Motiliproteus sp.]|jgi:KDO2-lipid IV(A) lauroyltransferase
MSADAIALRSLLGPRYWLAWLGFGLLRLAIMLPFRVQLCLGRGIGRLLIRPAHKRADIARANIRHCFPQMASDQQEGLLVRHFESLGIALFETAQCWWGSRRTLDGLIKNITGLEHIKAAQQRGKGIILLSAHFSTLEIGGRLLVNQCKFAPVYRRMNSRIQEYFTQQGRSKGTDGAIAHTNIKAIIRQLKKGGAIWFASDQQHQGGNSALVDFLGQPAHSATGTSAIARLGKAVVIPFFTRRVAGGYEIELLAPLEGYPSGDAIADTARYHRLIEQQVERAPEQYLWVHRRFKGAPGAPY